MADTWQDEAWTRFESTPPSQHFLVSRAVRLRCARRDGASDVMFCAYCGRMQPWRGRRHWYFWPSNIYAECWPCAIEGHPPHREPWWWRWCASRIRIDWTCSRG